MPDVYSKPNLGDSEEAPQVEKDLQVKGHALHELQGHTHNPLSSFCYRPDNVRFETQDAHEKIVLLLRQHPIVNIPWILIALVLVFAPIILGAFPLIDFLPERYQFISIVIWYLVVTAFVIESFLSWFFNIYIVTDEKIVDIDFHNLIYKEVSDAKISSIQEVNHSVGGVIGTMFNFGHIKIQTAGAVPTFDFLNVSEPARVVRIIGELRQEEEQEAIEGRTR